MTLCLTIRMNASSSAPAAYFRAAQSWSSIEPIRLTISVDSIPVKGITHRLRLRAGKAGVGLRCRHGLLGAVGVADEVDVDPCAVRVLLPGGNRTGGAHHPSRR